jgi:hypothetical protein
MTSPLLDDHAAAIGLVLSAVMIMVSALPARSAPAERLRVGEPLPTVQGSFLTGRSATLPAASAGKTALLLLGFTYESRHAVEPWAEWFRKAMGTRPDVTFFEVPMIGGLAKLGRWFIDRGMRKGTPEELHEHVITVYGDTGDWKRRLGVSDTNEDDAFLIVIDPQGIVRWLHHGPFDAATAEALEGVLTAPAGSPTP